MDVNYHVRQGVDLCGPACAEMLLRSYGVELTQEEIAHEFGVFKAGWGTPPENLEAFFNKFFHLAGVKKDMTLTELQDHIDAGCPAIALIQQIFPEEGELHESIQEKEGTLEDGHYVVVIEVHLDDPEDSWVLVSDPSNSQRQYDEEGFVQLVRRPDLPFTFRPFYKIPAQVFESIWYDQFENGEVHHGVIIWFDPQTKIEDPSKKA